MLVLAFALQLDCVCARWYVYYGTRKVEAERRLPRDFAELACKLAGLSYLEPRYLRETGASMADVGLRHQQTTGAVCMALIVHKPGVGA